MAEVFRLEFEVGAAAPVSLVAGAVADLGAITQGAHELAVHVSEAEADLDMMNFLREGGVRGLVQEARRRELPGIFGREERDLELLEQELEEWLFFPPRSRRSQALVLSLLSPGRGYLPWTRLVDQLRASEVSRHLPDQPYRYRSLKYGNPFDAEILAASGAAATGLAFLLTVIRDWGSRRRRGNAAAADAEDQAWARAQMRRLVLDRIARGELPVGPEMVASLLSDDFVDAADRLSRRELEVMRLPEAEDSDS
ncbi:hypothetical protein [Streptomyces lydicus]|uniref:hypothetical protein n=1 Tax=Streptomyces lydicus TaxID=47763 RepID=UPI0033240342